MTHQEIKELAGHRTVSPWVMKLVGDAVAKEREACAKVCEDLDFDDWQDRGWDQGTYDCAKAIRARGQQ